MLDKLILPKAKFWLNSPDCKVKSVIDYIAKAGFLREPQREAIEIYLFLKLAGQNKPLWQLFCGGFFTPVEDLAKLDINETARKVLENDGSARSLFAWARAQQTNGKNSLETYLIRNVEKLNCGDIIKSFFYGVEYTDYLFSLPMGAGKTYLMAALMYLDLYFADNEPDNKLFAHNFLVLIPSGMKSSILPSLKTIERFEPSWVIPEPAASNLKRLIKFEVLDQPKTANKSNKAKNPNAQKIAQHQPFDSLIGLVAVVNAEKVILDRLQLDKTGHLFEKSDDEKDKLANELRNIIGKIPNLQIHIDEVHHATDSDIKLRQVVNNWSKNGTINSVLGYSGTPYLASAEKFAIAESVKLGSTQITNTVYYYPLTRAIKQFLKKPTVKPISELNSLEIVKKGVAEFLEQYQTKVYADGTLAKLAIYCGTIERLEEEIFPFLVGEMKIPAEDILKFHKGNKEHKIAPEAALEFASLDTPLSKKRIVLLVQIGKEGWDCRSLTGVVLSQKGDCPTNMVLQTSCRPLRQVVKDDYETAGVWLNADNAKLLDKQLKDEQHTSIAELNSLGKGKSEDLIERFSRTDFLKLPPVEFYQLRVEYDTLIIEEHAQPKEKIAALDTKEFFRKAEIVTRGMSADSVSNRSLIDDLRGETANFQKWLFDISKASFGKVNLKDLRGIELELKTIFGQITVQENGSRYFNDIYRREQIENQIRLAFHQRRELQTRSEIIPKSARLLAVEKPEATPKHDKLYPNEADTAKILELDASGKDVTETQSKLEEARAKMREMLKDMDLPEMFLNAELNKVETFSNEVASKDRSFHILPYNFAQSGFEMKFLKAALEFDGIKTRNLEIYFNGESHLTEFRIDCYSKNGNGGWKRVGLYTPDFLLIERRDGLIYRVLIIETKGSGFQDQKEFVLRRKFVETEFLKQNNEKFGYAKFDYLFLLDSTDMTSNLTKLKDKIKEFFKV